MAARVNERASEAEAEGEDTLTPLRALLDAKAFREIVELYDTTLRKTADAIQAAARRGDLETIRRNTHDLAGLCGQLGCGQATALARRIEGACADNDERGALTLVPELKPAIAEALAQLARIAQ